MVVGLLCAAGTFLWLDVLEGPRLPWGLDIAGIGAFLILVGRAFKAGYVRLAPLFENRVALAGMFIISAAALWAISASNGSTNLNGAIFGNSGLLYLLGALTGTLMIIAFAALLPSAAVWKIISGSTLTIFATHIYLVRIGGRLLVTPHDWINLLLLIAAAVAVTAACTGLSILLKPVVSRVMR